MILTVEETAERHWCLWCPDLIVENEPAATNPELRDPLGEQGYAHPDCARAQGHDVEGEPEKLTGDAATRAALRKHIRENGPIEIEV